jgi:hypothetical protein
MNTYPRVDLTYHGDGNVGIGTPPDASAPLVMGEPVEHLRVSMTDGVGITPKDMNREDIIRMAQEAGFKVDWQHADVAEIKAKRYEYFAALVAKHEREACAKVCEETTASWTQDLYNSGCMDCAAAIRARGKQCG